MGLATAGAAQPAFRSITLLGKGPEEGPLSFYYQNEFYDLVSLRLVRDSTTHRWQPQRVAPAERPL